MVRPSVGPLRAGGASRSEARERRSLRRSEPSSRHLCTTCRTRETGVPDCTSSQTCGATTVRANVHERPSHHRTDGASRHPSTRPDRTTTRTDRKGNRQRDARHRHLEVARRQRRVPGVVHRRHPPDAGRHPDRQAPPRRQVAVVGRGDDRRRLRVRRDVPGLRHRPPPVDRPRRQEPRVEQGQAPVRSGRHPQAAGRGRLVPDDAAVRGGPRHRRRHHPRHLLRPHHLHLELVAEARPGRRRHAPRSRPARTAVRW